MERLGARYRDLADIYAVYIREAHPSNGWRMESNDRVGIVLRQPVESDERDSVAGQCSAALEMSIPMLVDDMEDATCRAWSAFPDRLYLLDRDGRVVFKSGRGPYGFDVREMEQALVMQLLQDGAPAR